MAQERRQRGGVALALAEMFGRMQQTVQLADTHDNLVRPLDHSQQTCPSCSREIAPALWGTYIFLTRRVRAERVLGIRRCRPLPLLCSRRCRKRGLNGDGRVGVVQSFRLWGVDECNNAIDVSVFKGPRGCEGQRPQRFYPRPPFKILHRRRRAFLIPPLSTAGCMLQKLNFSCSIAIDPSATTQPPS